MHDVRLCRVSSFSVKAASRFTHILGWNPPSSSDEGGRSELTETNDQDYLDLGGLAVICAKCSTAIEGDIIKSTRPVRPQWNRSTDYVSQTVTYLK